MLRASTAKCAPRKMRSAQDVCCSTAPSCSREALRPHVENPSRPWRFPASSQLSAIGTSGRSIAAGGASNFPRDPYGSTEGPIVRRLEIATVVSLDHTWAYRQDWAKQSGNSSGAEAEPSLPLSAILSLCRFAPSLGFSLGIDILRRVGTCPRLR